MKKVAFTLLFSLLLVGCGSDNQEDQNQVQKDACFIARQYMFYGDDEITGTNQFNCVFSDHVQTEEEGFIEITLEPSEYHPEYEEFVEYKETPEFTPFFVFVDTEKELVQDLNISPIPFVKDGHSFKPLELSTPEETQ